MASNCKYFDEDSVYRINKKGRVEFGLVLENAEYVSSDEDDEVSLNVPQWDRMKRGHVRVAWHPRGREQVLAERKVKLQDRSLMPGDIVRKVVEGRDTQLGYCRNTDVCASVQVFGTNLVVEDVSSSDLLPLERFSPDVAIFLDSWVGMVQNVKTELTVHFADGSTCILQEDDALDLDDVLDRRQPVNPSSQTKQYKRQTHFYLEHWSTLRNETRPLPPPHSLGRFPRAQVKVVCLFVQGVCKAFEDTGGAHGDSELIKYVIEGDALDRVKMINIFERCALQIGDRNYYTLKATDSVTTLEAWKRRCSANVPNARELFQKPAAEKGTREPSAVAGHGDAAEANSQSGSSAEDGSDSDYVDGDQDTSDSTSMTSGSTASSLERRRPPGLLRRGKHGPSLATKLLRKRKAHPRRRHPPQASVVPRPGDVLITETLNTETTVQVVWQDGTVEDKIPSSELYPIHHLDGHEFFPGDFVVENTDDPPAHEYGVVKRVDHSGRTAVITLFRTYMAGADPHPLELGEQEVSVYDIKDHPDFKYRPASCVIRVANFEDRESESTAGQVVDVHPMGKVQVQWVSGKSSLCYPQELYRIGEYDSDDLWDDDDDDDDSQDSWETQSERSLPGEPASPDEVTAKAELIEVPPLAEEAPVGAAAAVDGSDPQDLRSRMQGQIELLRMSMARLEEMFTQNPTQQSCFVVRKLLELYRHCRTFDQLLGTSYFQERCLQSLVDRLRQRGRINSSQHVSDQIMRLFSASLDSATASLRSDGGLEANGDENSGSEQVQVEYRRGCACPHTQEAVPPAVESPHPRRPTSVSCRLDTAPLSLEPRNLCQQLCAIIKARLLQAHEDVQVRFGMSPAQLESVVSDPALELDAPECELPAEPVAESVEEMPETPAGDEEDTRGQAEPVFLPGMRVAGVFSTMDAVPDCHKYKLSILQPNDPKAFFRMVRKEMKLLTSSLPEGIYVKAFEDRMSLMPLGGGGGGGGVGGGGGGSVLIRGPRRTPYEDGLFLFDLQFPADYPHGPPLCHYVSYCSDRLNPNLYEGGKVCISLLGTWGGKGSEMWSPTTSSLLQVLISIQGLILVSEPYYNEAGYEQQRGSQQAEENSRMYNEMVVLKLVQAMGKMIQNPPEVFKEEIEQHFRENASR
ncbi:unnamed protein product [Ixodes hexagonus]